MARAVHGLEGVVALFTLGGEHVVAVLVPVAGFLPQGLVQDLRALDFLVAVVTVDAAHVLLHLLPQRPALGVPEDGAGRVLVDVEQIQLLAKPAVVALFGFLHALDVGVQLFLVGPGGAVDALQLLVFRIAAPVGACQLGELEGLEKARVGHVRAAAHVHVFLVVVQAHRLLIRHVVYQAQLVVFAARFEDFDHLGARRHFLDDVVVLCDQLLHALLDGGHVFRREGALVGNVVIKAFLDHRADHHLGGGIELLDRMAHQVGAGVADDLHALFVPGGDDLHARVMPDQVASVHQAPIHLAGHRVFCQPSAYGGSYLGHRDRAGKFASGAVGKSDVHCVCHVVSGVGINKMCNTRNTQP